MYSAPSRGSLRQLPELSCRALGPFYYQHQGIILGLFFKTAIKSFSVATHLFRGIIITIRKSLRWGTTNPLKLSEWHHVSRPYLLLFVKLIFLSLFIRALNLALCRSLKNVTQSPPDL